MDQDYIAVHKKYRNQGLASLLLEAVENFVREREAGDIFMYSLAILNPMLLLENFTRNTATKKSPKFPTIMFQAKVE